MHHTGDSGMVVIGVMENSLHALSYSDVQYWNVHLFFSLRYLKDALLG